MLLQNASKHTHKRNLENKARNLENNVRNVLRNGLWIQIWDETVLILILLSVKVPFNLGTLQVFKQNGLYHKLPSHFTTNKLSRPSISENLPVVWGKNRASAVRTTATSFPIKTYPNSMCLMVELQRVRYKINVLQRFKVRMTIFLRN